MPVPTTCPLDCPDRCSILCREEAGEVRLRGNPDHPYTRGFTCAKIRRYPKRLTSPHRIREPWIRRGDRFHPVTWDEALDRVCGALDQARRREPESVLLVRGAGSMGVSKAFTDYVFRSLGARRTRGSLCEAAGIAAVCTDAGALDMNDPRELDRAEAIVLWGKNPRASSVHAAAQVTRARERGVPVLAINPDPAAVASLADDVVRVRPGTDRFLALACAKLLLAEDDTAVPWERTANRAAFEALLSRHALPELLAACDVAEADARRIASFYARTPRVATLVGWGMQRHRFGGENVRAAHALAFLAGSLGVSGGGFYYCLPLDRHLAVPRPARPWGRPLLLPALGTDLPAADPPVRFAWLTCSNLLNQGPDAKAIRAAFEAVETVVAVDGFWTETARHATVVLPPALWLEEEDVAASYGQGVLGAVRRLREPPEGCRTDFEIGAEVGRRLGLEVPYPNLDAWLAACLPGGDAALEKLRARGWLEGDQPSVAWADGFAHADGKFRLLEALNPEPAADPHHPLRLLTLVRRDALHSQLLPEEQRNPLAVRLHPATAAAAALGAGSPVRVVSAVGELEGRVHLDPELHPEVVASPRGGWINLGLGVNEATRILETDLGSGTAYYATEVRVERVAEPTAP